MWFILKTKFYIFIQDIYKIIYKILEKFDEKFNNQLKSS